MNGFDFENITIIEDMKNLKIIEENTDLINNLIQFLLNPEFSGWLLFIKVLFLLIILSMVVFIIFSLLKTGWLKFLLLNDTQEFLTYKHYGLSKTKKRWSEIEKHLKGEEPEVKLAIIKANSLLDGTLEIMGYKGYDLTEKLENINSDILENLEEVKKSHKVYSDVAHDPTYQLDFQEAEKALKSYRDALVNLGAL